ncbi:hypothetical protein ACN47E_000689 [Coniothyrium glycines]
MANAKDVKTETNTIMTDIVDKPPLPPRPPTPALLLDTRPTTHDFTTLPPSHQQQISSLCQEICRAWGTMSLATPLNPAYFPHPDTHNWDLELLTSLRRLAHLTTGRGSDPHPHDAAYWVSRGVEFRNKGLDHEVMRDLFKGDFVMRPEDVEYAIFNVRRRFWTDTYVPREGYDARGQWVGKGRSRAKKGAKGRRREERREDQYGRLERVDNEAGMEE